MTRPICFRCRLPQTVCVCDVIQPAQTRHRVLILQHPRERHRTVNTARLVPLVLPNSRLLVGASFDGPSLAPELEQPAYVVFPGPEALGPESVSTEGGTLVFLDGTWSTARKMFFTSSGLSDLPCVAFQPSRPSRYRIRKQPDPSYLCTLEAVAELLGLLAQGAASDALLRPFDRLVERQLSFRGTSPRRIKR